MKNLNTLLQSFFFLAALGASAVVFNACEKDKKEHNPGVSAPTATTDPGIVINGVRWATRNVNSPGAFAEKSEDKGMLYQWNSKVAWTATNPTVPSDNESMWNSDWNGNDKTVWETQNDPCPQGWRLPTRSEWNSLFEASDNAGYLANCREFTISNETKGKFFGDNAENKIFLPAAGGIDTDKYQEAVGNAWYWGSNAQDGYDTYAEHILCIITTTTIYPTNFPGPTIGNPSSPSTVRIPPAFGLPVRCVAK